MRLLHASRRKDDSSTPNLTSIGATLAISQMCWMGTMVTPRRHYPQILPENCAELNPVVEDWRGIKDAWPPWHKEAEHSLPSIHLSAYLFAIEETD